MYKLDGFPYYYKEANIDHSILTKTWRVVESAGSGLSEEFNLLELPGLSQLKQRQYNLMVKLNGLFLSFYSKPTPPGYWIDGVQEEWAGTVKFPDYCCNSCGLPCVAQHSTTCYSPLGPCLAQQEWPLKASPVEVWNVRKICTSIVLFNYM